MELFWWLYLATRLDTIKDTLTFFTFVIGGFIFIATIMQLFTADGIDDGKYREYETKVYKNIFLIRNYAIAAFILSMLFNSLLPSKRDAILIAGGVGVVEAAKAIKGSSIANKSLMIIEEWLDNELESLRVKKKPEGKAG